MKFTFFGNIEEFKEPEVEIGFTCVKNYRSDSEFERNLRNEVEKFLKVEGIYGQFKRALRPSYTDKEIRPNSFNKLVLVFQVPTSFVNGKTIKNY